MKKEMTPQDIVKNSGFPEKHNSEWENVYALLHDTIEKNTHRVVRTENTLFWVELHKDGNASVEIISADKPEDLDSRVMEFLRAVQFGKFKIVKFNTYNIDEFEQLSKSVPLEVEETQDNAGNPMYCVYVDVQKYKHSESQA